MTTMATVTSKQIEPARNRVTKDSTTITVNYLYLNDDDLKAEIVATAGGQDIEAVKRRAVELATGDPYPGDEYRPHAAWLKYLHESNGLKYTTPAHPDISHAIEWTPGAMRFLFWLC